MAYIPLAHFGASVTLGVLKIHMFVGDVAASAKKLLFVWSH